MSDMTRNEFLRGAMAAGAASFAHSLTGDTAAATPSTSLQALGHVQRLVDAASDRLSVALTDAGSVDPSLIGALESVRARALAIAAQVEAALPLG